MKGFESIAYIWMAEYIDGSTFKQFDEFGKENLFSEVRQTELKRFGWIPVLPNLNPVSIALKPGQKLICYRKNFVEMLSGVQTVIFVLGIKDNPLIWIFQDEVVIGDNIV